MLKTHEDIQSFIKEMACGAKVSFLRIKGDGIENTESMRRYVIEKHDGVANDSIVNVYALPVRSDLIGKTVKETLRILFEK